MASRGSYVGVESNKINIQQLVKESNEGQCIGHIDARLHHPRTTRNSIQLQTALAIPELISAHVY